jgi:transglutaminase superfamily protein
MRSDGQETRQFYTESAPMTSLARQASLLEGLPDDPAALAGVLHGLVIHEHMGGGYGVTLSEADRRTVHVRRAGDLLAEIAARDPRPLDLARLPEGRLPGNCRHFTVLAVALLRAHGIPARARCGFGGYFGTGWFEDHWVAEYWHVGHRRWQLLDAQVDDVQLGWFPIDFDLTDVPRDQFLVGGEAWRRIRAGEADPEKFGLSQMKEAGDWWIAANLMRDGAALLNLELLPWDCWGAMPTPVEPIGDDLAALFDRLAELTLAPDDNLAALRLMYEDDRLRVPATVRNAVRGGWEPLWPEGSEGSAE